NREEKKKVQNDTKEESVDPEYEQKIVDYVVQKFYEKEGINLKNDKNAINRICDEVKKQLVSSKKYPIIIDIPYIIVTNDGSKSLHIQIDNETEIENVSEKIFKSKEEKNIVITKKEKNIKEESIEKQSLQENAKKKNQFSNEEKSFNDNEYERKVVEYVIQEFKRSKGIDLHYYTKAVECIHDEVRKQLSLSKGNSIIINIPNLVLTNNETKLLYIQIDKKILQSLKEPQTTFQKTQIKKEQKRLRLSKKYKFIIVLIIILCISIPFLGLYNKQKESEGPDISGNSFQEGIDKGYDDGSMQVALQYVNQNQKELETFFKDELLMEKVEFEERYAIYNDLDTQVVSYDVDSQSNDFDLQITFLFNSQGVFNEDMTMHWNNNGSIEENPISLDTLKMEKIKERFGFDIIGIVNEYKTKLELDEDGYKTVIQHNEYDSVYLSESNDDRYFVYLSLTKEY
ncbi:Hsp70 family protein, partial [Massilimicrobiota timonensis]|uniref:Hsp70 family protein n=1 Tax=Massilimicrobiota timonensis TaxID=1776392 RepID=UPI00196185E4